MDVRNNQNLVFAKNCTRTANVQITDKDTPATYYGAGEVVITDTAGTALTTVTALKTVPEIMIHQRSADGTSGRHVSIRGEDVISYSGAQYLAAQEQVTVVDITEFGLTDYTYQLNFKDEARMYGYCYTDTISVKVGTTALSKVQLAQAFVDKINLRYDTQNIDASTFALRAAIEDTDKIVITAYEWHDPVDGLNVPYNQQRFTVEPLDFDATVTDNKLAALTGAIAYPQATRGIGTWAEVNQSEKVGRMFSEKRFARVAFAPFSIVNSYDVPPYEADGTTPTRYDIVTIRYKRAYESVSGNHSHEGVITIYLPVEDNATSQVGVITTGIVPVLNQYFATEWEKGTAFTIT